ncbi:hypothetical protein NLG97_g1016 [Lecanicillium saksenae]|uniref:Uncharacterized protein n=1 Tax=Lecanicillium saksenae TaxID=468837 RepID=A0ACC1R8D6_9HYPO|nr:hypothetical protein NLG97_g1016 [Lecanicillium saksenae]
MEVPEAAPPEPPNYSIPPADTDMLKLRRASSRVWSDLRGAIKAIGKPGSQNSNAFDYRPENSPLVGVKGENGSPDLGKEWAMTPAELVKRLRLDTFGITPSTTVILRSAPLRNRLRRSSAQAFNNMYAQIVEPPTPSPSPENTVAQAQPSSNASASRKVSMESLTSTSSKEGMKRRNTHRFLRAKSNPETLSTIKESCQDVFTPTILTTEKAAAVKITMETYYNELLSLPNSRLHRRHYLEAQLYYNPQMTAEQKDAIRRDFFQQESCYLRQCRVLKAQSQVRRRIKNNAHTWQNFEPVQVLGKGSFGVVRLVREKKAGQVASQVFAMKVIRKSEMLSSSQEGHLRAERDFLVAAEGSNWIVPLVTSFQDFTNLYLVMEYMPGGDFLGMLMRESILHETIARFYIAEMILAVEETHRLKFIHRDIKPDNFLISASGHLKISDFGLAFDGHWSHDAAFYSWHRHSLFQHCRLSTGGDDKDEDANTKARVKKLAPTDPTKGFHTAYGDMNHFSPRSTRCRATAYSVWSIGIILFECLYGFTPFGAGKGRKETKQNITKHKEIFCFPSRPAHKDRCPPGSNRMTDAFGYHVFPDDAEDIKRHRWFKHFRWDQVPNMTPPFVPNISSPEDTHYFEESEPPEDWSESSPGAGISPEEVQNVLHDCRQYVQKVAVGLVAEPHNSSSLRMIDSELESSPDLSEGEKQMLKRFIRLYGRRQRKRPRDVLLRDAKIRHVVMEGLELALKEEQGNQAVDDAAGEPQAGEEHEQKGDVVAGAKPHGDQAGDPDEDGEVKVPGAPGLLGLLLGGPLGEQGEDLVVERGGGFVVVQVGGAG